MSIAAQMDHPGVASLPYRIGTLCYLFDDRGRLLLVRRRRPPSEGMYSPIAGRLAIEAGESPAQCAIRTIRDQAAVELELADVHLTGLVSETGYEGDAHWLLFLYEVIGAVKVDRVDCEDGSLEWYTWDDLNRLPVPDTDREAIYPLLRRFHWRFFHLHIDCTSGRPECHMEYPAPPSSRYRMNAS